MILKPPAPLTLEHDLESCQAGIESLELWLRRRALKNQSTGASRTFVACSEASVVAYYSLASGAIMINTALGHFRRNMPDPIPVVVLGRLAVDRSQQRKGVH